MSIEYPVLFWSIAAFFVAIVAAVFFGADL